MQVARRCCYSFHSSGPAKELALLPTWGGTWAVGSAWTLCSVLLGQDGHVLQHLLGKGAEGDRPFPGIRCHQCPCHLPDRGMSSIQGFRWAWALCQHAGACSDGSISSVMGLAPAVPCLARVSHSAVQVQTIKKTKKQKYQTTKPKPTQRTNQRRQLLKSTVTAKLLDAGCPPVMWLVDWFSSAFVGFFFFF